MKKNKKLRAMEFVALITIAWSVLLVSAQVGVYTPSTTGNYQTIGSSVNVQSYQPGTYSVAGWTSPSVYWSDFDSDVCRNRQDFIVQVLPGGCQPAVVRSDLLEEQNAPVFCKIMLIQTNPLIDVSRVKTIRFLGTPPKGVAGVTYFPPRYNLMQRNNIADTPIDDNIGYFVVSLKRTPNEKDMPDWIEGNLTAIIDYDVESALGTGRTNFYVSEVPEEDWLRDYKFYSFWNGKGYLKTESIEPDRVTVSVYRDFDTKEATLTLKKGETSAPIYLGGFYCAAGLKVTLENIDAPVETALLQIGDDTIWVSNGDKIMDNQCTVGQIKVSDSGGKVSISCPVSNGKFDLSLSYGKVNLAVGTEPEGEYSIGKEIVSGQNIYLAYSGTLKNGEVAKPVAVIVSDPWVKTATAFQERELFSVVDKVVTDKNNRGSTDDILKGKIQTAIIAEYNRRVVESKNVITAANVLVLIGEKTDGQIMPIKLDTSSPTAYTIKLGEVESLKNKEYSEDEPAYVYYQKAIQSYKDLADFYPQEKRLDDDYFEPYAAEALSKAAILAELFGRVEEREEFYSRLRADYPDSSWTSLTQQRIDSLKRYDTKESRAIVNLRAGSYFVSVLGFKRPTKDTLGVDLMINGVQERLGKDEIYPIGKAGETNSRITGWVEGIPTKSLSLVALKGLGFPIAGTVITKGGTEYLVSSVTEKSSEAITADSTSMTHTVSSQIIYYDSNGNEILKADSNLNLAQAGVTWMRIAVLPGEDFSVVSEKYKTYFEGTPTINPASTSTASTSAGETLQVTNIEDNKVELLYNKPAVGTVAAIVNKEETLETDKKEEIVLGANTVRLLNIDVEKQAKLVLDSEVRGPRAYTNFSFKIGIEKRGIKLSPEKTKEMMENIEESIKKWEDINEKLGKVVKGLKGACFATSAILTAKNLVTGFSGEAMARNELMTMSGGWNDYCEKMVNEGRYYNIQACLLDKNPEVEGDVAAYAKCIQNTNDKLGQARSGITERTDILDIEGYVKDRQLMESNFRSSINCQLQNGQSCDNLGFDATKEIYTLNCARSGSISTEMSDAVFDKLNRTETEALARYNEEKARADAAKNIQALGMKMTYLDGDSTTRANLYQVKSGDTINTKNKSITSGTMLVATTVPPNFKKEGTGGYDIGDLGGQPVLIEVKDPESDGVYTRDASTKMYDRNGNAISAESPVGKAVISYLSQNRANRFVKTDAKAYENKIKNPEKLTVKYFERAPYKGLPAEVPFDVQNGWYAEMEYVLSGFGKPYDESGKIANFYICNVGPNGNIEFKRNADDICRYYNGISDELGFPGLDATQSRSLVAMAKNSVVEASKYYGKKEAYINGQKYGTGISFSGSGGKCTDFMSPKDCNIMFNVCDPVICPASRCDLGGTFPVDNVIQTGIIGSLVLCLPNLKEGIYIPVCLSGVHAGIEGYLSILKSHRDCLNESLTTGKTIGICDEIQSIYLCEFFWRQMVPFFDVIVPRLVESFMGQGARGGGEYLTAQSAWDNTQKSIDYFTNEYSVNSMKAFQMRSTEEAGTEMCKSFISTRYPTDLDLLTEPDSPVQYHAWFDENILTTATPYPTSHYKVYYHIYAGKDRGAYYTVYLKDISQEFATRYTYQSTYYIVPYAQGYIPAGETVDEAKDFTAPSGYKQLCIKINGQDECGFGKVSTSFAVDYISDKYAAEQAQQDITTSKECVAGTPSLYSLAQPNVQAGAEEVVEPELYNQGIVRVCSTYNPGRQVNAKGEYDTTNSTFDRWKDVGYCDDKTLRCWLDTESVKDVIKNKELESQVLDSVDTSKIGSMDSLTYEGSKETSSTGDALIASTVKGIPELKADATADEKAAKITATDAAIKETEDKFKELSELGTSNSYKARGLLLLGELYRQVAEKLKGEEPKASNPTPESQTVEVKQADSNYQIGAKVTGKDGKVWVKDYDNLWRRVEDGQTATFEQLMPVTSFVDSAASSSGTTTTGTSTAVTGADKLTIKEEDWIKGPVEGVVFEHEKMYNFYFKYEGSSWKVADGANWIGADKKFANLVFVEFQDLHLGAAKQVAIGGYDGFLRDFSGVKDNYKEGLKKIVTYSFENTKKINVYYKNGRLLSSYSGREALKGLFDKINSA
ncbi:hypothetical protein A3K73_08750 [Candidatus Pacearchaeota archaeon RBG_13_36_9]|nr:MAG: hypothetical protein A3K73_08750 [Candidatus Pacearchaeota archaeon RBG_13_36_9]